MATKSFLTANELDEARERLKAPARPPNGDERRRDDFASPVFSAWLADRLLARLSDHPDWHASGPVALGSWARGELSPKSDIDLLFCGSEEAVRRLVQDFARQGLKLRYRMPENPDDWTQGVLPFDVLALFSAVPLTKDAANQLEVQLSRLRGETGAFRKNLLKAMMTERKSRAERYDSISNFLEPNLKFGPGGLRDLEQALVTAELFSERFPREISEKQHAFDVLLYYKRFFLLVRQRLHLADGAGDVLAAPEQKPIADWLGFASPRDFMREIQKGVSRVSFYADWVIEQASRPVARIREVEKKRLLNVADLFSALENDPSLLMQNRVRLAADRTFNSISKREQKKSDVLIGRHLTRILDPHENEASMVALFRSRLIDHCVPEFRKIVGHVQHDQYHRFSVDAHILQALRELKRIRKTPSLAGKLKDVVKGLSAREWEILAFTCLYHDIAKGREGDHSVLGIDIAEKDLKRFGKNAAFISEVTWIVEQHLALSSAAFRENPRAPRTWQALADKGVRGRRLHLLAVFTIVDIRATNPEAWTPWKERLLHELLSQLERPETGSVIDLGSQLKKTKIQGLEALVETLDPFLIGSLPPRSLVQDLKSLAGSDKQGEPLVVRLRGGKQTWVRFHSIDDRPGLFLHFVSRLAGAGLSVRHASIQTDPLVGVYDWFEVKTTKAPAQIRKLLSLSGASEKRHDVHFDAIELVGSDEAEWVISFRGKDQSGALLEAARALFEEGVAIRWAKVHTWGRQIDDVFGVVPPQKSGGELESDLLTRLQARLVERSSVGSGTKV